ncbi:prepilin-type N-terminal cleavage/methylation domain-containing protein [candidate division WOR-3 bacterium]|nr:prepilin-type N-terminal cleavage/methylation domain-containing protein [candidate division WOR-3 bacterium]
MRRTSVTERGWSLVELLVVISVLGIILAFFVPPIVSRVTTHARVVSTQQEMNMLREAIAGNSDVIAGGQLVSTGFRNDVGRLPRSLVELATRNPFDTLYARVMYVGKETLPAWDPYIKKGWNGPYVREDGDMGYMDDVWGVPYRFIVENNETLGLESAGPDGLFYGQPGSRTDDDIRVRF